MALVDSSEPWIPEETFAARLRLIRHSLDLTTAEIAKRVGVPGPTWNTWENGSKPQRMDEKVALISETLGVDRAWLMWGVRSRCLSLVPGLEGQLSADDLGWTLGGDERPSLALVEVPAT